MSLLEAVVLGFVQGLTEFVPISSSGHLVIVPELFGWQEPGLAFDVLLHAASLAALLAYFRRELSAYLAGLVRRDRSATRFVWLLVVGTIPAALAGALFANYFERAFTDERAAAVQLLITAVILVAGEQLLRRHRVNNADLRGIEGLRVGDAAAMGVAQAVAIFPGISRSGATISAGLALAVARDDAARFSFLLAIPALFGATLLQVPELWGTSITASAAAGGFFASLISSYVAIAGLIRFLRTRTLYPFAAYCVIAGIVFYLLV